MEENSLSSDITWSLDSTWKDLYAQVMTVNLCESEFRDSWRSKGVKALRMHVRYCRVELRVTKVRQSGLYHRTITSRFLAVINL